MPDDTTPDCDCNWFRTAAQDPAFPVIFDEQMNEFHLLTHNGKGHALFYYCPFCGGKAPKSYRGNYFAQISPEETYRLHELTKHLKTEEEALSQFGPPQHQFEIGGSVTTPGSDTEPKEHLLGGRRIIYTNLSDTADVHVEVDRYGKLKISFSEKYIGPSCRSEQDASANL